MDVKMKDPALVSQDSRACAEIPQTSTKIQIRHYPDANDDGKSDVLVGNFCVSASNCASGTVNVLLGNGDGTFHAAVGYNSGAQGAVSVAVADVNGDGKPDLIVANFCASNTCTKGSVGQAVTWTPTVTSSGSSAPTGKVTFTWDGNTIRTATLNASGAATPTKSNLNADAFPLTAVYSGDAANLGSTSAVLNQVVQQATSAAAITSSPTVVPTGPVIFTAGKSVLGMAQLGSGKAKLAISSLPVGSTKVKATYNGDSNIAKSSASVTQTVLVQVHRNLWVQSPHRTCGPQR
jgi:hypothetical protein